MWNSACIAVFYSLVCCDLCQLFCSFFAPSSPLPNVLLLYYLILINTENSYICLWREEVWNLNSYLLGTVHVYATSYVSAALLLWGRLKAPSGKEELCN